MNIEKLKTRKVTFLKSAVLPKDFPPPNKKEVGFVGRSNAGKSSLLNAITVSQIARVSGSPGKTTLLNFFDVGDHYRIVDMPGYGYASRSHTDRDSWKKMIESYILKRTCLKGLVLIMDIRRDWDEEEEMLKGWLDHHQIPLVVVLNKADKLKKEEVIPTKNAFMKKHGLENVFTVSCLKKQGIVEIEEYIFTNWIKNK